MVGKCSITTNDYRIAENLVDVHRKESKCWILKGNRRAAQVESQVTSVRTSIPVTVSEAVVVDKTAFWGSAVGRS